MRASATHLDRFAPPHRTDVQELAASSRALADLADSFPAMLFALATGYGTATARRHCLELVLAGRPLKEAAAELGLPLWLKRLPPEAFDTPLTRLPAGEEFGRRIVNHLPLESWKAVSWFRRVTVAADLAGEDFALWLAWRTKAAPRHRDINRIVLLSAWAFYSSRPDTLGHGLLRGAFAPGLGFRKALEEAEAWKRRVDLAIAIGEGISDAWYPEGEVNGFRFVPLQTLDDFLAEAAAMDNCLDQYGTKVGMRATRIFSVRQGERRIADVEFGPHDDDCTMPAIEQLRGPGNRRVPAAVWTAAYAFLGQQKPRPLGSGLRSATIAGSRAAAKRIWRPFVEATTDRASTPLVRAFLRATEPFDPGIV
ncbi:MAG: hypothetical protein R3D33_12765 [Hyphomicrobiaceae bacterium]